MGRKNRRISRIACLPLALESPGDWLVASMLGGRGLLAVASKPGAEVKAES